MLQRLGKLTQPIDIVFLDPPYEAEDEYSGTLNFLGSVRGRAILAPHALVIAEHSSKAKLATRYGALEHTRLLKQGDAALSFFGFPAAEQSPTLMLPRQQIDRKRHLAVRHQIPPHAVQHVAIDAW